MYLVIVCSALVWLIVDIIRDPHGTLCSCARMTPLATLTAIAMYLIWGSN